VTHRTELKEVEREIDALRTFVWVGSSHLSGRV